MKLTNAIKSEIIEYVAEDIYPFWKLKGLKEKAGFKVKGVLKVEDIFERLYNE